jgi:hypothetical protein
MSTVIGLFQQERNVQSALDKLQRAGFKEDNISVLTRAAAVQKLLEDPQSHVMGPCVLCGALFGFALFGLVNLFRMVCQCTSSFPLGLEAQIMTFLVLTVIGTFFGAVFGAFAGADKLERKTHLYTRGVCCGYKVLAVKGSGERLAKAAGLLQQEQGVGVKIVQDREEMNAKAPASGISRLKWVSLMVMGARKKG